MNFSNMHYIYVLYSASADRYYFGYSSDPWKRLEQHLTNRGEKYTGSFHDWELRDAFEVSVHRSDVDKIEKFVKRQKSRIFIERILEPGFKGVGVLAQLVRVPHARD
jgi:putative endonuclease